MAQDSFRVRKGSLHIVPGSGPSNPELGDEYVATSGIHSHWDGAAWDDVVQINATQTLINKTITGTFTGNLTGSASNNVLKAGDTMTGTLAISKSSSSDQLHLVRTGSSAGDAYVGVATNSLQLRDSSVAQKFNFDWSSVPTMYWGSGSDAYIQRSSSGNLSTSANFNITGGSSHDLVIDAQGKAIFNNGFGGNNYVVASSGGTPSLDLYAGGVKGVSIPYAGTQVSLPNGLTSANHVSITGGNHDLVIDQLGKIIVNNGAGGNNYIVSSSGGTPSMDFYTSGAIRLSIPYTGSTVAVTAGLSVSAAVSTARADIASGGTQTALNSSTSFVKLTGSSTTTIQGIVAGRDGQDLLLVNLTGQNVTISHENAGATAANRITTMTGADVVSIGNASFWLKYDTGSSRWLLVNSEP